MSTLDLDTIQELLSQEKKREEEKHLAGANEWYKHGFEKRLRYLFDLPYDRMFQKSNLDGVEWQCIGCGRLVKDRESHYNWHKNALGETK